MSNPNLIKNYIAETAVTKFRIVKWGTADGAVVPATATATDALIGVVGAFGAAAGERVDVIRSGLADVEYGGTVTRGQPLMADANGKAVAAAPAAGVNARIVGYAEVSGVAGDIGSLTVGPELIQG